MSPFYSLGVNNSLEYEWRWCYLCVSICVPKWAFGFSKREENFYNKWANISFSRIGYFIYNRIQLFLNYFTKYLLTTRMNEKLFWYLNDQLSCPWRRIFPEAELWNLFDLKSQLLTHNHTSLLRYINSRQGIASEILAAIRG